MDLLVACDPLLVELKAFCFQMLPHAGLPGSQLPCLLLAEILDWRVPQGFELRLFGEKEAFHAFREVRKERPAGGDLLRLRCSLPGTICKCASAIPADDLDTRMGQQPLFEGLGFSIRQQVDGNPPFKVDEDRSIAPASAKAKIVYTQHTRRGHLALLLRANQSQERVRTGLYPHSINQALACFPAECKPDQREQIRQARVTSGIGSHDVRQTFGEDLAHTFLVQAEKAPHMQVESYRPTRPASMSHDANIARV